MLHIRYRKVGGMHWLFVGRLRFAWCISKTNKHKAPTAKQRKLALIKAIALADKAMGTYDPWFCSHDTAAWQTYNINNR